MQKELMLIVALLCIRGHLARAADEPISISPRAQLDQQLFCGSGTCLSSYRYYANDREQYESGFNDGMRLILSMVDADGTDARLRKKLDTLKGNNVDYVSGFFGALEAQAAVSKLLYSQSKMRTDNPSRDADAKK